MSKAERLLDLLQCLRGRRKAVSAMLLAEELNVSDRTIYRDIEALRRQGAHIRGEAGVGFVLDDGFLLPPIMFTPAEVDTIISCSIRAAGTAPTRTIPQPLRAANPPKA